MLVIKVAVFGILASFISLIFKNVKSEYSTYIGVIAAMFVIFYSVDKIEVILEVIHKMNSYIHISTAYTSILLKIVGIAYISEFAQSICKDAGYSGIAAQIEMFCKLSIIVVSLPVFLALLDTIEKLLQ